MAGVPVDTLLDAAGYDALYALVFCDGGYTTNLPVRAVRGDGTTLMDALDGNAIGGLLIDVFGTEMTAARTTCATCADSRPVAELAVYQRAPGTVVRCRTCGSVLMVFVDRCGVVGVDLSGLASLGES